MMVPECTFEKQQACGESVMVYLSFCWERLGPITYEDSTLSYITCQNVCEDQICNFMVTIFYDHCDLFQQDNTSGNTA